MRVLEFSDQRLSLFYDLLAGTDSRAERKLVFQKNIDCWLDFFEKGGEAFFIFDLLKTAYSEAAVSTLEKDVERRLFRIFQSDSKLAPFAKLAFAQLWLAGAIPFIRKNRSTFLFGFNALKIQIGNVGGLTKIDFSQISAMIDFTGLDKSERMQNQLKLVAPLLFPEGADLSGISMAGVQLYRVGYGLQNPHNPSTRFFSLVGVNLSGSDQQNVAFVGVDLTRANLSDCDLRGCDFRGATLDGACFEGARIDETTLFGDWHFIDGTVKPTSYERVVGLSLREGGLGRRLLETVSEKVSCGS